MKFPECDGTGPGPSCVDCGASFHLPDGEMLLHHRTQRGRVCTNCKPAGDVRVYTCHAVRVRFDAPLAPAPAEWMASMPTLKLE